MADGKGASAIFYTVSQDLFLVSQPKCCKTEQCGSDGI
jgi:hypothetical protein